MQRHTRSAVIAGLLALSFLALTLSAAAQTAAPTSSVSSAAAQVPPVIQFSDVATDAAGSPLTGSVEITFSLYNNSQGGASLWSETQNVTLGSSGQYAVYLGITKPLGVPLSLFTSGEAHWLGVQIAGQAEQPRVYLVSVPYAMKAGDAATIGGLPPSAFVMANPAIVAASSSGGTTPLAAGIANLAQSSKASRPPTDTANYVPIFTDEAGDLTNSIMSQSGTTGITVGGNLTIGASNSFFIGADPFAFGSYANQNAFFGFAGNATTTGTGNTAVGVTALEVNTTGRYNNAIGDEALQANTTGIQNNAIGLKALLMNKTGSYNVAIGGETLVNGSGGTYNVAIGYQALNAGASAFSNTAVGYDAMESNTTGFENTAYGSAALYSNTTGKNNTGIGYGAGPGIGNLSNSTAIGAFAEVDASNAIALGGTGPYAVSVGIGTSTPGATLDVQGSGNFTGAVSFGGTTGTATLAGDTGGDLTETIPGNLKETVDGDVAENAEAWSISAPLMSLGSGTTAQMTLTASSILTITAPQVVITGTQTFNGPISATSFNIGTNPIAFGTYGSFNAFLGFAGNSTTTGTSNTGTGYQALKANTSGYLNTATGYQALAADTIGYANTAMAPQLLIRTPPVRRTPLSATTRWAQAALAATARPSASMRFWVTTPAPTTRPPASERSK